jgi:hypothetical protein
MSSGRVMAVPRPTSWVLCSPSDCSPGCCRFIRMRAAPTPPMVGVRRVCSFVGWLVDGQRPDRWDIVGAGIALVGMVVIAFGPRP